MVDGLGGWETEELCVSSYITINKMKVACQDSDAMEDQNMSYVALL